jgi:hypothetical protein
MASEAENNGRECEGRTELSGAVRIHKTNMPLLRSFGLWSFVPTNMPLLTELGAAGGCQMLVDNERTNRERFEAVSTLQEA